jgi:hypothetical protein
MGQRQAAGVIDSDPGHLTVLLREKVARRPLPGRHYTNAEDKCLVGRAAWPVEHGQQRPSEGRHADLLAQLARERLVVSLARLMVAAGEVPEVGIVYARRCTPPEEDVAIAVQQRPDTDRHNHSFP